VEFGLTITSNDGRELDPRERVERHVERAFWAREYGFTTIAVGHRYSFGPTADDHRGETIPTWRYQPLLLLAYVSAQLGQTVNYATAVLVATGLHPVQLAEDIATLDSLCGGRLRVGIGLGWLPYEFEAFEVERATRVRRFEELLAVTCELLTKDEVTFSGQFFKVSQARLTARTVQRPRPPIWLGATTDAAVLRAARLGDTWSMSGHTAVPELVRQRELYLAELAKVGRPPPQERPINRVVYLAEDRKAALDAALPNFIAQYRKREAVGGLLSRKDLELAIAEDNIHWIVGDQSDCFEQLNRIKHSLDANLTIFTMPQRTSGPRWEETIRVLGEEVLPRLQSPVSSCKDS
jgi:alkanesulfonate monooxygenase SsuD/methylene tetrahydromethanopterin reductase-like flavin-dependent oxidoreductase (luciferase family)